MTEDTDKREGEGEEEKEKVKEKKKRKKRGIEVHMEVKTREETQKGGKEERRKGQLGLYRPVCLGPAAPSVSGHLPPAAPGAGTPS